MANLFYARSENGELRMSEYTRAQFRQFLKDNDGIRIKIEPLTPESRKQRAFFEGAICPLVAFYQEGLDYHNWRDIRKVHEFLKLEFNPEIVIINGEVKKIAGSTKGELNRGFIEKVMDWMVENGYQVELLMPSDYEKWRDEIFPFGGTDNYIDYLLETNRLHKI